MITSEPRPYVIPSPRMVVDFATCFQPVEYGKGDRLLLSLLSHALWQRRRDFTDVIKIPNDLLTYITPKKKIIYNGLVLTEWTIYKRAHAFLKEDCVLLSVSLQFGHGFCSHHKMNSANNLRETGSDSVPSWAPSQECNQARTLISTLWNPEYRAENSANPHPGV